MRKNLPDPNSFIGLSIEGDGDFKLVEHIGSGCNALVFRGQSEILGHSAAYKIIPSANLAQGDEWKTEAQKANLLQNECVVKYTGFFDYREKKDCVILKTEYVDGISLLHFLKHHKEQISIPFIHSFLHTMLNLLYEMKERGIAHSDLHMGNILVMNPSKFQRNSSEKFKITDFGIGNITSIDCQLDDYSQTGRILIDLLSCLDYQRLSPHDKYIYDKLHDHFAKKHLQERDQNRDPLAHNPDALLARLEEIEDEYKRAVNISGENVLITPFDYLSCEQIGQQHSLLHALYSEKFLGITEIEGANNLVVTGPRGCGKSTVFRSLSLKHQIITSGTGQSPTGRYVGIYYHCNDLYFKFPRYKKPAREEAIDLPLHYLTARLLIEVLETLNLLLKSSVIGPEKESKIAKEVWNLMELTRPGLPSSDRFSNLIAALHKECQWAAEKYRFAESGQPIKPTYGPDKFIQCCALFKREIPDLDAKSFYCFIDDYSMPHVSEDLQKTLNRLLMQRNEHVFFKMATESPVSFATADIDGKTYTEEREFEILNLGLIYMHGDKDRKTEFLDDVFSRRLKAVSNYPVKSLQELIGEGDGLSFNEIASKIFTEEKIAWWGRSTLSHMCSGDIHQLITLVRKMVSDQGGQDFLSNTAETPKINSKSQNKAIRAHAGNFLQNLCDNGEHGSRLSKIIAAFGSVANSYIKFRISKNETGSTRHQASRIELYETPTLTPEAKEVYDELIRYSVFIQDPRGKSRRGNIVPRLYLRRFLVPHFNLTFSLRDSLPLSNESFQELLLDPERFERRMRLRNDQHTLDLGQDGDM